MWNFPAFSSCKHTRTHSCMPILSHWENIVNHNHSKLLDLFHTSLFAFFFVCLFNCVIWFCKQCLYCECDSFSDCIVVDNLDNYIYAVGLSICLGICFCLFSLFVLKSWIVDVVECVSVCTWLTVWKQWC